MDNKVSLEAMIYMAVKELEHRENEAYLAREAAGHVKATSKQYDSRIETIIEKKKSAETRADLRKLCSKVAMVFFISFSMLSMSFLTVEAVRESVAQVVIEWYDKFARTTIVAEENIESLPDIEFGYIPDGFELVNEISITQKIKRYEYANSEGKNYMIMLTTADENNHANIDNERLGYYTVIIDETIGLWIFEGTYNKLVISREGITYNIAGDIPLNEIINIYKTVKIM